MFTDDYQASYRRVLDDFISSDNELLLAMFRIAVKHYRLRGDRALSYFYRFPSLEKEFIFKVETILREKAKTKDNKITYVERNPEPKAIHPRPYRRGFLVHG